LPEAHVEAPTSGSILLAGILLKLGTYGFIRFLLTLFPYACTYYSPLVIVFCLFGVIYGSFGTIRQVDLKKNYCIFFCCSYEFCNSWSFFQNN